jgi:hypothetical protein
MIRILDGSDVRQPLLFCFSCIFRRVTQKRFVILCPSLISNYRWERTSRYRQHTPLREHSNTIRQDPEGLTMSHSSYAPIIREKIFEHRQNKKETLLTFSKMAALKSSLTNNCEFHISLTPSCHKKKKLLALFLLRKLIHLERCQIR